MNWKDLFHFERPERIGALALVAFVVVAWSSKYAVAGSEAKATDFTELDNEIAALEAVQDSIDEIYASGYKDYSKDQSSSRAFSDNGAAKGPQGVNFAFDPNTATLADFEKLGLRPKVAQSIVKFREKGGKFRKPEDFKKIYTLSEEDYLRLLPFVNIASAANTSASAPSTAMASAAIAQPFAFDPNTASEQDFQALGLSSKTAQSILNYRNKGGKFRSAEDFKKIYALAEADYLRLQPYIQIAATAAANPGPALPEKPGYVKKSTSTLVNICTGTVEDFQKIPGIGASLASRIVKYREQLGGFVKPEQIGEVFGLPDSTFQKIRPQLVFTAMPIAKININTATEEELDKHPYLHKGHAGAIVRQRQKKGNFTSVEQLRILDAFDDNKGTYDKVKAYLTI